MKQIIQNHKISKLKLLIEIGNRICKRFRNCELRNLRIGDYKLRWKRMIWLAIICSLALRLTPHFLAFLAFPHDGLTTENRQYISYVLSWRYTDSIQKVEMLAIR